MFSASGRMSLTWSQPERPRCSSKVRLANWGKIALICLHPPRSSHWSTVSLANGVWSLTRSHPARFNPWSEVRRASGVRSSAELLDQEVELNWSEVSQAQGGQVAAELPAPGEVERSERGEVGQRGQVAIEELPAPGNVERLEQGEAFQILAEGADSTFQVR